MQQAVIFDMDGVMVDNGGFHYRAWQKFCANYDIAFSEEKFKTIFFGRTNQQVLPDLFERDLPPQEIKKLAHEKEQIYREIYQPFLQPVNGLIEFLHELKSRKIPVGVATSAPKENVGFVLNGLGVAAYVDAIVDDSMVANGKPNPEIYFKAAELLKVLPRNCVVFEDSLSGTKSAFAAGTKVIAITTTLPADKHQFAHEIMKDFTDINFYKLFAK